MTASAIRKQARKPQFRMFELRRIGELRAAGLSLAAAKDFARKETRERARVSLSHPIDQVLNARLEMTEGKLGAEPRFKLIYLPTA